MDFYKVPIGFGMALAQNTASCCGARQLPRQQVPSSSADRCHSLPSLPLPPAAVGSLPMNRYAHLSESEKQDILNQAHNVRSEMEMYTLVASLANGPME